MDFSICEVCYMRFDSYKYVAKSTSCGHMCCMQCLKNVKANHGDGHRPVCPFCHKRIKKETEDLDTYCSIKSYMKNLHYCITCDIQAKPTCRGENHLLEDLAVHLKKEAESSLEAIQLWAHEVEKVFSKAKRCFKIAQQHLKNVEMQKKETMKLSRSLEALLIGTRGDFYTTLPNARKFLDKVSCMECGLGNGSCSQHTSQQKGTDVTSNSSYKLELASVSQDDYQLLTMLLKVADPPPHSATLPSEGNGQIRVGGGGGAGRQVESDVASNSTEGNGQIRVGGGGGAGRQVEGDVASNSTEGNGQIRVGGGGGAGRQVEGDVASNFKQTSNNLISKDDRLDLGENGLKFQHLGVAGDGERVAAKISLLTSKKKVRAIAGLVCTKDPSFCTKLIKKHCQYLESLEIEQIMPKHWNLLFSLPKLKSLKVIGMKEPSRGYYPTIPQVDSSVEYLFLLLPFMRQLDLWTTYAASVRVVTLMVWIDSDVLAHLALRVPASKSPNLRLLRLNRARRDKHNWDKCCQQIEEIRRELQTTVRVVCIVCEQLQRKRDVQNYTT